MMSLWKSIFRGVDPIDMEVRTNGVTTDTPNMRPVLERISERIGVVAGCCGYGAKAGDEIGRQMAALMLQKNNNNNTKATLV